MKLAIHASGGRIAYADIIYALAIIPLLII
jgi:hypothetical protein